MTENLPVLRPFAALRPTPVHAAAVLAPPYDVLDSNEAWRRAAGKPHSFLHISKAEIDLAAGTDPYAPAVYAKAAENLNRLVAEGVLVRETRPCFYVYRLTAGAHVQTGIVGAASVAAYDAGRIRRHEFTRPEKEDDRVRQIEAVNAHTGPVLAAYRPNPMVAAVTRRVTATSPLFTVTADDGVTHGVWQVADENDGAMLAAAFAAMPALFIADGHHRSAAASRVAAARRAANPARRGEERDHSFLLVSFPADEMVILDYNRIVSTLNGLDRETFLAKVAGMCAVTASPCPVKPVARGIMGMYLPGQWYHLAWRAAPPADPVAGLDVSLLTDRLLAPVLGITDLRQDRRIDFMGGARGLAALAERVDGGASAAFAMYPPSMDELMAVTEAGRVMPPKSTWFEPKLADGLLSLPLE